MTVRVSSASPSATTSGLRQKAISSIVETPPPAWVRNPSWPPCDANPGDQKMVLLNAVYNGKIPTATNFLAFKVDGGNFTVDFGDGTVTNYLASTVVEYQYSFNSSALVGTDAPVTINATTETIDRTAHGYTDGMLVTLYNVTSTPEVRSGGIYYVINATANAFQVSATSGGSPIAFSVDGTATLLPYRIATVTVTPQAGQSITGINLDQRHSSVLGQYGTDVLDVCVAFSTVTTLAVAYSGFVKFRSLERFRILQLSSSGTHSFSDMFTDATQLQSVTIAPTNISNVASMFNNCTSLVYAPEMTLTSVSSAGSMFQNCRSLYSAPSYNMPSCTNFSSMFINCGRLQKVGALTGSASGVNAGSMFSGCYSLVTAPPIKSRLTSVTSMFTNCAALVNVPAYDTTGLTAFSSMFIGCESLEEVPLFNTQSASDTSAMFATCSALKYVPLLNTQNVTNMSQMFQGCTALQEVPRFNTQNVGNMSLMFSNCYSLRSVPLFNTQFVTNMSTMFQNCRALISVPLFNTQNVTNMSLMFQGCTALRTVPLFNTSRNVNISTMFSGCSSLEVVPQFDTRLCTSVTSMFSSCLSLSTVPSFDFTSATSLGSMFSNCSGLVIVPGFTAGSSALTSVGSMFQGCTSLSQVGPTNVNGVTSATNFNGLFQTNSSLTRMQFFNMRFSFTVANCALSKGALEEIFDNLATVSSATVTVTNNFGIGASATSASATSTAGSTVINTVSTSGVAVGMLATGTNCPVTSTVNGSADPATDTITAVAHGLNNGRKVAFSSAGVTSGLAQNTVYYVVNATTDTFQVSSTVGGAPIDFGGSTSAVTFRYPNYVVSVNPGVSITMDAPQARTGTATIQFRSLDLSSATFKNWSVTL